MNTKRRWTGVTVASIGWTVLALMLTGCMSNPMEDPDPNFTVTQEPDIPSPRDFILDKDRSSAYIRYADSRGAGYFRSGWMTYYGDQQVENLAPWYLEQMEKDGWTHKSTRTDLGKKRLAFTKGGETATIWLYREFDPRFDKYLTFAKAEVHPTPTEEMATEELIRPAGETRSDAGGKAAETDLEGTETGTLDDSAQETGREQKGIIRRSSPAKGKETVLQPSGGRVEEDAGDEGKERVANDETGTENSDESQNQEEVTPEDEKS